MLFNSFEFLIFFILVSISYFVLPHRFRWFLLLSASCYFYMFFIPIYILILIFTIIIDYVAGIMIENAEGKTRKNYLALSIVANVGVLAVFKYYNFFIDNFNELFHFLNLSTKNLGHLGMLLPVGLSFHTFQAMSYTIEVYRGNQKAERHFGIYALYVMFYPQLVAGPIERPQNILHQFHEEHKFSYENAILGLNKIAYGLFKKVVVADRLSVYVNSVYGNIENASSISVLIAVFFFSIQIYCDFSGYSDIAIGTARFMGFDLMNNFDRPYLSKTISEFWTRWHISLSTWFKDYLYIPLGGNRRGKLRWYFNLFTVFVVSGFWHGANWTFLVWGMLHGFFSIGGTLTAKWRAKAAEMIGLTKLPHFHTFLNVSMTFLLVTIAWVFFRAPSFHDASLIFGKLWNWENSWNMVQLCANKGPFNMLLSFVAIVLLSFSYLLPKKLEIKYNLLFLIVITLLIVLIGKSSNDDFIYFQF